MIGQGLLQDYKSVAGAWVLDSSRSDTMEQYLRCLHVPDTAIQTQLASETAHESRHVIGIAGTVLTFHQRTAINSSTKTYELDTEKITQTVHGESRCTVSLRNWGPLEGLVSSTKMLFNGNEMVLMDIRQVQENGILHKQEVHLNNSTTGERCVTFRTWVRVPVTQQDQEQLLA